MAPQRVCRKSCIPGLPWCPSWTPVLLRGSAGNQRIECPVCMAAGFQQVGRRRFGVRCTEIHQRALQVDDRPANFGGRVRCITGSRALETVWRFSGISIEHRINKRNRTQRLPRMASRCYLQVRCCGLDVARLASGWREQSSECEVGARLHRSRRLSILQQSKACVIQAIPAGRSR